MFIRGGSDEDKIKNMNAVTLAFVGDAAYSLFVREKLVKKADIKSGELNRISSAIVCAKAQHKAAEKLSEVFTEEEKEIYRRGRNAKKPAKSKSATVAEYNSSTGFEAVLGYLYLVGNEKRLTEICEFVWSEEL